MVEATTAAGLRKELDGVWAKSGKRLEEGLESILSERGHGLNKSFFDFAAFAIKQEVPLGKLLGQTTDYTCVATSLRMCLDDLGIVFDELTIAKSIGTVETGANRGVSVMDIPKFKTSPSIYYSANVDGIRIETISDISFGDMKNILSNDKKLKAIVSVGNQDIKWHALIVDKIETNRVFVRDPLPAPTGSSYSVSIEDFEEIFNKKVVLIKNN